MIKHPLAVIAKEFMKIFGITEILNSVLQPIIPVIDILGTLFDAIFKSLLPLFQLLFQLITPLLTILGREIDAGTKDIQRSLDNAQLNNGGTH